MVNETNGFSDYLRRKGEELGQESSFNLNYWFKVIRCWNVATYYRLKIYKYQRFFSIIKFPELWDKKSWVATTCSGCEPAPSYEIPKFCPRNKDLDYWKFMVF